jgi:hypothetical protein
LECLARDDDSKDCLEQKSRKVTKAYCSQQNIIHHSRPSFRLSHHSNWDNLPVTSWIVSDRQLLRTELTGHNAKLPIADKTAQILQRYAGGDVATHDENRNFINNGDRDV